jgi:hypothetical protein
MTPIKLEVGGVYRTLDNAIAIITTVPTEGDLEKKDYREKPTRGLLYRFISGRGLVRINLMQGWSFAGTIGRGKNDYDLVEHLGNITDLPAVKALTSTPESK